MPLLDVTIRQVLIFAVYALPAVLFWYFIFRFQNRKALHPDIVRDTFFIGIFSVIPLFLYQYAYLNWAPSLGTQYLSTLLSEQSLASAIQIFTAFFAIGLSFVLVIGGFTIFYSLFTKDSLKNTLKALISEPLNFGATGILLLILLVIDLLLRAFTSFHIPPGVIGTTFILAILEEYSKHLIVRLFDDHKIKNVANAVEFSIIVALSFAFLENIIYLQTNGGSGVANVIIGRSVISMLGHIVFSAIFGYYYGISKFSESILHMEKIETHAPALPQWLHKVFHLKTHVSYKSQKIFEGLVFAALVHFAFNLSLHFNFMIGIILILVGGGYLIYRMLNSDLVQREWSLIGSKEMPQEDFEKLAWRVSVQKHLQEIQRAHPDSAPAPKQDPQQI